MAIPRVLQKAVGPPVVGGPTNADVVDEPADFQAGPTQKEVTYW
jgi:hypothetical protein